MAVLTPTRPSAPPAARRPLWQRVLGLRRREGRYVRIGPTRWGWTLLFLLLVGGGGFGFMEYSMRPDFCRTCHLMEPYYTSWLESSHSHVACTDCHFEPGLKGTIKGKFEATTQAVKYITGTWGSKPHAQISDMSCLRSGCHEHRVLEGKIHWQVPSERGGNVVINFDHTPHLGEDRRGKQLRCVSCHSQMVQGEHLAVTLDTCFLCHFKGFEHGRNEQALTGCQQCHEAPKHEIRLVTGLFEHGTYINRGVTCENCHADSIVGDGEVPRQVCWVCHNVASQVARYEETDFIHDKHIADHKVRCSNCHLQIEHSLTAAADAVARRMPEGNHMLSGGQCATCHQQMHGGPHELYKGTGGIGVADMPSPMFRANVNCIACHRTREQAEEMLSVRGLTFTADRAGCVYCHGQKYDGTLEDWQRTMRQQLAQAEAVFEAAVSAFEASGLEGTDRERVRQLLNDAGHNVRFVRNGHGVHNMNYATALLSVARQRSDEAMRLIQGQGELAGGGP
jgi:nitrate/TMAO reductase-like tetraheme cytochrome c subunit